MARSISKMTVPTAAAQAICFDAFGGEAIVRTFQELTDGYFNAAYLIELADDRRCVLKVAPPAAVRVLRYEHDIMHAEVEVMRLVRAHTTMPVPEIYRFDASGHLLESPFFLMEFVPGVALDKLRSTLAPADQQAIDREVGAYLRQMNGIVGVSFGYIAPPAKRYGAWRPAFLAMLDDVLADGAAMEVGLLQPYDVIRRQVERCAAVLDEVITPQLVHWDLWDGNIFVDPATHAILGVIDFERALWGDPLMEVQYRRLEAPAGFAEGYGRPLLSTPAERLRRVLYNIYLYLIIVIEAAYRQYESQDLELWARQQLAQELERLAVASGLGVDIADG
jgi:aminoglycoside phosphotransferase (APT) family kinase protein